MMSYTLFCSCVFMCIALAWAKQSSSSEEEQTTSLNSTANPMLSLAKTKVEDIQKMFGNISVKLEEKADEAMKKFKSRSRRHDNRRHGKGRKGGGLFFIGKMCCNFPSYLANKQHAKACHQEFIQQNITRSATREENQEVSKCFMQCIAKKKGWAKEDGTIDREAVSTTMASGNVTEEWKALITKAQEKCFAELPTSDSTNDGCRSDSQQLMYCIFEHHFLNCPTSSWRENEKCRAAEALIAAVAEKREQSGTAK